MEQGFAQIDQLKQATTDGERQLANLQGVLNLPSK